MNSLTGLVKNFWEDEEGLQTLEIMLIIAVIVVIALMFRDKITSWIKTLFQVGDDNIDKFGPDGGGGSGE